MSSTNHSFFAHLDPIRPSTQPTLIQSTPSNLLSPLSGNDTEILLSRLSPVNHSPYVHRSSGSSISPSLHQVLENMQTQISTIMNRLDHFTIPKTPTNQTAHIHVGSRPSSSHSIVDTPSSDTLTKRFLQVEVEYHQLKRELNARSFPNHPPNVHLSPSPSCHYQSSSAFQPITKVTSVPLPTTTSHLPVQSNQCSSPAVLNNSATNPSKILSKLSNYVPPHIINSAQASLKPIDVFPSHSSMPVQPLLSVPFNSISSPAFTMSLANNFPTFKGMANDKPIKFIKDFEFRVPSYIRNNDVLLLETVQQVLLDGALTWFGQLQQSVDRVDRWTDFKSRFYQRYHTAVNVHNLRTELQLLFQGDKESTLDYFDRLKTLLVEIDPDCSDQYIKRKFVQKMRSDIRSRFDVDINLSISEFVRAAQMIESNIEQQKIDEKLKSATQQEKKHPSILLTNNLSTSTSHRRSSTSPHIDLPAAMTNHNSDHNNNFNDNSSTATRHPRSFIDRSSTNRSDLHQHRSPTSTDSNHSDHYNRPSDIHLSRKNNTNTNNYNYNNNNNNNNQKNQNSTSNNQRDPFYHDNRHPSHGYSTPTNNCSSFNVSRRSDQLIHNGIDSNNRSSFSSNRRYWCPHCQRHGHSWQRCPNNPDSINYRGHSTLSTNDNSENFTGR